MRVLSFIPTLLFAVASLVAAAPLPNPDAAVPVCAPAQGPSSSAAQPVIDIVVNATSHIEPLAAQLTAALNASPADDSTVADIVAQIDVIVVTTTAQLHAAIQVVDWTSVDIHAVADVVLTLVVNIYAVLVCLTPFIKLVVGGAVGTVETIVCSLLRDIIGFVGCLKFFVGTALGDILGPVLDLTASIVATVAVILNISL